MHITVDARRIGNAAVRHSKRFSLEFKVLNLKLAKSLSGGVGSMRLWQLNEVCHIPPPAEVQSRDLPSLAFSGGTFHQHSTIDASSSVLGAQDSQLGVAIPFRRFRARGTPLAGSTHESAPPQLEETQGLPLCKKGEEQSYLR